MNQIEPMYQYFKNQDIRLPPKHNKPNKIYPKPMFSEYLHLPPSYSCNCLSKICVPTSLYS